MRCDQSSGTILKFSGVFPEGMNHLHEAIEIINREFPFKNAPQEKKVRLLKSNFTDEHRAYVVEIHVPYRTSNGSNGCDISVPLLVLTTLFDALNVYRSQSVKI